MNRKIIEDQIKKVNKDLKIHDVQSNEYAKDLKLLAGLQKMEQELDNAEKSELRLEFDKDKFSKQNKIEENKLAIEKDKLEIEKRKLDLEDAKHQQTCLNDAERLSESKKERDNKILLTCIQYSVPAIVGLTGIILNNRMGLRSLNMEYVDSLIVPKTVKECSQNINKFIKG